MMNRRMIGFASVVLLLLIGGTVWALRSRSDAQLEKVREMGKALFTANGPPPPEKREEFRNAIGQLSDSQRESLFEERRQEFERREDQRMATFFAMSPQQQTAYLDKEIQDEEKRAKDRAARRAQAGQQSQNRTGAMQGPGPGPGQMGPRGGGRTMTSEQRLQRQKRRLDNTTPERRAQRSAYRDAVQKRRIALGLPPNPPRGPGRR